jgi:hypothetical protein
MRANASIVLNGKAGMIMHATFSDSALDFAGRRRPRRVSELKAHLVPWLELNSREKRCEIGLSRDLMNMHSQPYERFQPVDLRAEKSGDPRRCQRCERIACEAVENLFVLREGPQT